jgi:epothilone polyketide synthase D
LKSEIFDFQGGLVDGFKRLRDGTNVGKVVIRLQSEPNIGTAVITGGLGGLGIMTAELLHEMGANHIVLVSRSGKAKKYAGQKLGERLENLLKLDAGKSVSIEKCDTSNENEVQSLLARVHKMHGNINTVIHASGLLNDSLLQNMTPEKVRSSFGAKAAGAWYLHQNTSADDIRHFVVFSSIAALLGNPGQTNYSASNSYLDSLVRLRRNKGLPALSIQWPAIADVGMAAATKNTLNISIKDQLSLANVKNVLKQLFTSNLGEEETVMSPIPLSMLGNNNFPSKLSQFMVDVAVESNGNASSSPARRGTNGSSKSWIIGDIQSKVEAAVRKVITIEATQKVDLQLPMMDMGLDSLGITELSQSLQSIFGVELPSTFAFNHPSIADMSNHLFGLLSPATDCISDGPSLIATNDRASIAAENSIVGMSCRFPGGVSSPHSFWELLRDGTHTSAHIPFDRWDASALAALSNLSEKEKLQVSNGSSVHDMELFDPSAFRISKAEAASMSPLQCALLECSYLALLDAGYAPDEMKGLNCGVFVGTSASSSALGRPSNNGVSSSRSTVYNTTGSSASIASGRISYVFNFQGPNAVYDTACSSSLVALDAGISALQLGKCDMALVAGSNELFDSKVFDAFARAGMLSPTGRCHTWDASADGYLRGEGCGAILLKPANAAKPGSVYANVLGASVMSDGTSASITAPNGSAQV